LNKNAIIDAGTQGRRDAGTGIFCISLDFELQYGIEDFNQENLNSYKKNILGGRDTLPKILDLFKNYNIHATWGLVGMMLAENKDELKKYFPNNKPGYANQNLSSYAHLDRVGSDESEDPYHYGLSLANKIIKVPGQEIGSHTFSHYYCNEQGQTKQDFQDDLNSADKIMRDKLNLKPVSLILPRNQVNNNYLNIMQAAGYKSFRGLPDAFCYTSPKNNYLVRAFRLLDAYFGIFGAKTYSLNKIIVKDGVANIKASNFLRPYSNKLKFLEKFKLASIKRGMLNAAKHNKIFHLWWHPHNFGLNQDANLNNLEIILEYYKFLNSKYNFKSLSMGEIAELI